MIVALSSAGVRVPSGFATTAAAYREFVSANGLAPDIRSHLEAYRAGKTSLAEAGRAIRGRFLDSAFPSAIADRISAAYEELGERLRLPDPRSEEHTSELQSLMRISYAVFCLKKKQKPHKNIYT